MLSNKCKTNVHSFHSHVRQTVVKRFLFLSRSSDILRNGPTNHPRMGHFGPYHLPTSLFSMRYIRYLLLSYLFYQRLSDWWGGGRGMITRDGDITRSRIRWIVSSWNGVPSSTHTAFECGTISQALLPQFSLHWCTSKSARMSCVCTFAGRVRWTKKICDCIF